ncbi:unnamed protein product [Schistocephalus solidus]|uniref:DUF5743 domain-containing protein n=1 Tax=Schistocephalus solidus TaxID=70667 RepID=A0A0X3P542_SCHSO|nr:unnamed protein product [Schistocephalus solidus]
MNLGSISDKLPTYPSNIQGELRLILQTKDIFMVCYKQLEEYRRLVNEQNRLITKEFVQEQLQAGEDEIAELKIELGEAESKLAARLRHNELLADQLASQGLGALETGGTARHMALIRSPNIKKQMMAQRKNALDPCANGGKSQTHLIDNIALAIDEIHQEVRTKVKPLLDYYRDLFYLQLHFSLVLGQVCNYCMPLVTENIGLLERVFFWAERPEFELIRKASDISDRLKEIYTRSQQIYGVLSESVRFLQSKVELQKSLETRFHERMDEQQKLKDKILREIHASRQNMDMLEEENDRLVGSLVKIDPTFVDSQNFIDLAEGGNLPNKHGNGHNNRKQTSEFTSSTPIEETRSADVDENEPIETSNVNARFDYNNNKALSVTGDSEDGSATVVWNKQLRDLKRSPKEKSAKPKRKSSKLGNELSSSQAPNERPSRGRGRKREERQKRGKRAVTANIKERAASSGTETQDNLHIRARSSSQVRSPSVPRTSHKNYIHRRKSRSDVVSYDTVSEGQASTGHRVETEVAKASAKSSSSDQSLQPHGGSLKSRLLDRTRGLFDLSRVRGGKSNPSLPTESDESSLAMAYQPVEVLEGSGALTSVSSIDTSYYHDGTSSRKEQNSQRFHESGKLGSKDSKTRPKTKENRSGKQQRQPQLRLSSMDDEMLVLGDQQNGSNSRSSRRRSKSRQGGNDAMRNDLANFLTSSASENLLSSDSSLLPDLN